MKYLIALFCVVLAGCKEDPDLADRINAIFKAQENECRQDKKLKDEFYTGVIGRILELPVDEKITNITVRCDESISNCQGEINIHTTSKTYVFKKKENKQ